MFEMRQTGFSNLMTQIQLKELKEMKKGSLGLSCFTVQDFSDIDCCSLKLADFIEIMASALALVPSARPLWP